jgi:hypothetical protein
MAKGFTTWTVLRHDDIEKHSENLWSVSGYMPKGNQRRMTVARRADGKLVIHNAVALAEPQMKEIEALGEPGFLIVPNGFHRQDAQIFKQRYPKLAVFCPQGARKRVAEVVEVAGHLDEMPKDSDVEVFHLRGMKEREGAMRIRSGGSAGIVFNDALLNLTPSGGLVGFFMAPTGALSVPRFTRWMMLKSGAELKEHLAELAATKDLKHVVPGHGAVVADAASAGLRQAAERLS